MSHAAPSRRTLFPRETRARAASAAVAFLLTFAGSLALHSGSVLHDTDAYYHLAIARAYAAEGTIDELPWTRLSLLRDGFGDKEWLFHELLVPFVAAAPEPLLGGRWALAFWNAAIAAVLAWLAAGQLGLWGIAVPLWLFFASTELAWRLVRLRPELLSLAVLLLALAALARRHDRWLGVLCLVYTLGYTAFQALWGLVLLTCLYFAWTRRRFPYPALAYASLGTGLGLCLHPHFPKNLEVWVVQNVAFFFQKGALDVGTEIRANFTDTVLMVHLGWFLGLGALWLAASPRASTPSEDDRRWADTVGLAALAFGFLYLLMSRFSLYFFPLATLWVLAEIHRRGRRVGAWATLPGGRRVPLAALAVLSLALSFPEARRQLSSYRQRTDPGPERARIVDRELLAAALPEGARVAADWGPTATYMLWAPHGRYLNVLDPIFLATPYPEAHRTLRAILDGREPDIPAAARAVLRSDYLAYPTVRGLDRLKPRLAHDPRVAVLHRGSHTLVAFRPSATARFVLDWRVTPVGAPYPRAAEPVLRALEGYVDAERILPGEPCVDFVHELDVPADAARTFELAPYGPTSLWLDERLLVEVKGTTTARLGGGVEVPVVLEAGSHRLRIRTCEGGSPEHKGFYLVER